MGCDILERQRTATNPVILFCLNLFASRLSEDGNAHVDFKLVKVNINTKPFRDNNDDELIKYDYCSVITGYISKNNELIVH